MHLGLSTRSGHYVSLCADVDGGAGEADGACSWLLVDDATVRRVPAVSVRRVLTSEVVQRNAYVIVYRKINH